MKSTNIFPFIFLIILVLSFHGCNIASTNSSDKTSEALDLNITPANNKTDELSTNSSSITPVPETKEINYNWYKTNITYVREDGLKTITFDWHEKDYVKFIFNDGFVLIESNLYNDDVIKDALLYEITNEETIDTVDIIYHYKENKIEVIDSEKNGYARSGYYYPEESGYKIENNTINYQWYEGKTYIGGRDGDAAFQMQRYNDGYFQFIFNKTYVSFGTNSISDTVIQNALTYNYNDKLKVVYYYLEDKVEVIYTPWEDDYICGYYYPGDIKDANIPEPPEEILFTPGKVYVRQDGTHVFWKEDYDDGDIVFLFDDIGTWSPSIIDDTSMPNATLYKENPETYEVMYYHDKDIIQINDFDNDDIDYSGYYYYVKSLGTYENTNEIFPSIQPDVKINYEWYSSDKEFISENGAHTFRMDYLDNGYLDFIFDNEDSGLAVHYVDDKSIPNGLLYELNGNNKIYVIYYYLEDKVQVVDAIGIGYNGFYYPQK